MLPLNILCYSVLLDAKESSSAHVLPLNILLPSTAGVKESSSAHVLPLNILLLSTA